MRNITFGATYSDLCSTAHKSDAATGEHGDLLDVIRETCSLNRFHDVADEARRFLDLPRPAPEAIVKPRNSPPRDSSPAKRLLRFCRPIAGTLAEAICGDGASPTSTVRTSSDSTPLAFIDRAGAPRP